MSPILFGLINREKLFKAHKIQREFNEKSKSDSFSQETEIKNLIHDEKRMASKINSLGNKLEQLEKELETNSNELEKKIETNSKELGNKLEEIIKLLKPE